MNVGFLKCSSVFGRDVVEQYGITISLQTIYGAMIIDCDDDGHLTLKIQLFKPKPVKI
jgi:hypothetical protein